MKNRFNNIWRIRHFDANGNLIDEKFQKNSVADGGERWILERAFRSENAGLYIRLFNDTPTETDTLADLTGEATGGSYVAKSVAVDTTDWPTSELSSGNWRVVSKTFTFTATGSSMSTVTYAVLATSSDNSGLLVAFAALNSGGSRTLGINEKLDITFYISLD